MTRRAIAFLLDPGPPRWDTLVLRVFLAAVYIPIGMGKFVNHDAYVERFERWGFGAASGEIAILVGILEVAGGLMLLFGVVPRLVAAALIGNMIGAIATAGRVDGGQDIWLPMVLIVLLAAVVVLGTGTWATLDAGRTIPGRARP
jgi:putative oxidoreductase